MVNVITSFMRRREVAVGHSADTARHRRDGYFDEHDQWHDADEDVAEGDQS